MAKRDKSCQQCKSSPAVMYRIWPNASLGWIFVCEACLLVHKQDNSDYRYGGTWKRYKR